LGSTVDQEMQDSDAQWRGTSTLTWCPPTTKEWSSPACAEELSIISAARYPNRLIGASLLSRGKLDINREL
jgi:hypothetical protein